MTTISKKTAIDLIRKTNGSIFGVTFIKRTTGDVRDMQARLRVTKYLTGAGPRYNAAEYDLIHVFDMAAAKDDATPGPKAYRSIPFDGITSLRVDGQSFQVDQSI